MNQPDSREESIFLAALALPPADRAAYLDRACPDAALRARVENLLAVQSSAEALCDPAGPESDAEATRAQVRSATESLTPTEKPGDLIGPYKLREQIGEGGCGTVYVAEQEKPISSVMMTMMLGFSAAAASSAVRSARSAKMAVFISGMMRGEGFIIGRSIWVLVPDPTESIYPQALVI